MANYHLTYTQAPLPFQGQKRFFIQQFARQIAQYPSDSTIVDLFGGSGLLSRVCKDIHPSARVLYNDHDHYSDRLALIPQTETIRQRLLPLVAHIPRSKRIDPATVHRICNVLLACQQEGLLIDYTTISTWLLYTMHYCDSIDELSGRPRGKTRRLPPPYHRVRQRPQGHLPRRSALPSDQHQPILDWLETGGYIRAARTSQWQAGHILHLSPRRPSTHTRVGREYPQCPESLLQSDQASTT